MVLILRPATAGEQPPAEDADCPACGDTLAGALVNELVEAADDKQLTRVVNRYARLDLLCLDELGYVHLDPRGAELLFQIITAREERASIACASNAPFSKAHRFLSRYALSRRMFIGAA